MGGGQGTGETTWTAKRGKAGAPQKGQQPPWEVAMASTRRTAGLAAMLSCINKEEALPAPLLKGFAEAFAVRESRGDRAVLAMFHPVTLK